jgi:hypothetical protein
MRWPFLTELWRTADDRRAATCLMTVFAIAVVSPSASARADERAPPAASLIDRGLAASFVPQLRLGAAVERSHWQGRSAVDTIVYGELVWPLGRAPAGHAIAASREGQQRAAARETLVERIAAAWHKRRQADDLADEIAARLAHEEADAEIEALTGDATEDEP